MPNPILKYFEYEHLPEHLQVVSAGFKSLANLLDNRLPDGPEKSTMLRKMLEAKDCAVRAALGMSAEELLKGTAAKDRFIVGCVESHALRAEKESAAGSAVVSDD